MNRLVTKTLVCLVFVSTLAGCTAGTDVVSLLGSVSFFSLDQNELRILSTSDLSTLNITGKCTLMSTGFEVDISNPSTDSWVAVPTAFVTANDQCATTGTIEFNFDLSTQAPFQTMVNGNSYQVRIRDINALGVPTTETFNVVLSSYNLASHKRVVGHGGNLVVTSGGGYSLKGRLVEVSDEQVSSASTTYTLKGKLVFQ